MTTSHLLGSASRAMAKLTGITPGLRPVVTKPPPKPSRKAREETCCACSGVLTRSNKEILLDDERGQRCKHCAIFFGDDTRFGVTNRSHDESSKIINEIREAGWLLILRRGEFEGLEVEPGDIFKVRRSGIAADTDDTPKCSKERTRELFSATVLIGPHELVLWPHEVSPIRFGTLMQLKAAGELEEVFVSGDDEIGHFKPTDALRAEIYATFGRLVNAPQPREEQR